MAQNKKIKICETGLRDAHQSLIATRMTTEDMLPVLSDMDKVGYYSLEAWGGATFDACLRFLGEDPWKRLRVIRETVKNTKLQMLFRGQNILGYRHYADDVVSYFVQKSIANGIDIIRIFDALNDPRNLKTAIDATKREGGHVQVAISYTTSPVHTCDAFADYAVTIADMGADSICIKDMAGLLTPYAAEELVRAIKAKVDLPLELHTHYTTGLASMTLLKAIEAGVDIIDTAISPLSLGTSQPSTEAMVAALAGSPYDTGLSLDALEPVRAYFATLRDKYIERGLLDPTVLRVDVNALRYQVPGGMLSNLVSQLKNAGKSAADVVLLKSALGDVPAAIRLSRQVMRNIKQNLFWAFFYNIIGIPIAAGVLVGVGITLNPMLAAAAMSLSSVCVVTNALRLNGFSPDRGTNHPPEKEPEPNQPKGELTMNKTMTIEGMMCMHCKAHVEKALNAIPGVTAQVDLEAGKAAVDCPAAVTDQALTKAVTDAGYTVKGVE